MNRFGITLRLIALAVATGLLGALIIAVTLTSQRHVNQARHQLQVVDQESFHIADLFTDKLRHANDKMRAYATAHDRAAWNEFEVASRELEQWILAQNKDLTLPGEQAALRQLGTGYKEYRERAEDLHRRLESSGEPGATLAEYNGFFDEARSFLDLGRNLARAHAESRNAVLGQVKDTLTKLRRMVLGLVVLLFACGLALGLVVYRGLIAPLRQHLIASQELAARNEKLASLGALAAGVAHEIRNPLTALKTALFIQETKMPAGAGVEERQIIEREVCRLERIVTEFLQFARPNQPQRALIRADQPLREVQELLAPELAQDQIELVREECPLLHIEADPSQLKQVLINLVKNAADSIGRQGRIALRARDGRHTLPQGEMDTVILEVSDTGKGIPAEVQRRLFDPFFTTKDHGTGLGLSIASRIAELNGGSLQYETRVGQGSTFWIVLPRAQSAGASDAIRPLTCAHNG
jgi:signal transduction histidine kinase